MNKIVREHYPVSMLPADLQDEVGEAQYVRVVIEDTEAKPPLSKDEAIALLAEARRSAKGISTEEAVARVRALRDEWDD